MDIISATDSEIMNAKSAKFLMSHHKTPLIASRLIIFLFTMVILPTFVRHPVLLVNTIHGPKDIDVLVAAAQKL